MLGSLSLAVQGAYDVEIDGRREPLSLYLLTVAPSGARKSATDNVIFKGIKAFERIQNGFYRTAMKDWKRPSEKKDAERKDPPLDPKMIFTDGTGEAIQRDAHKAKYANARLDHGRRRPVFRRILTERGAAAVRPSGVTPAFGTGTKSRSGAWVRGDRTRSMTGASCCIFQVQAAVVKKFLTDPIVACQGLLGRFLVAQVEKVKARGYRKGNPFEAEDILNLYVIQRLLLEEALECEAIDNAGVKRKKLTLTSEAEQYWSVVHNAADKMREDIGDDALASFYGKTPAHVLRVAGVLAASSGAGTDTGAGTIGLEFVRNASQIVHWFAADMDRAQDLACVSERDEIALGLLHWLKRHQGEVVSVRDIQRNGPRAMKRGKAERIKPTMARLIMAGVSLRATSDGWEVGDMGDNGVKP